MSRCGIGSQSILGSYDYKILPGELTMSIEADIVPLEDGDRRRADLIDGPIGEASMFHDTYGVYAQGVDLSTALLAPGWNQRLVRLVDPATGPRAGASTCTISARPSSPRPPKGHRVCGRCHR